MSAQWPEFDLDRTSFADILSLFEVNLLDSETQSTKATGDKLEMATAELWGACGDVFRFAGSRQTYAGQIDGVVEVHTSDPVLRDWGSLVIYECKNWTDPAGLPELAVLLYKMQLTDAKVGMMFSTRGITKVRGDRLNGEGVVLFARWHLNRFILYFDYTDLEAIRDGTNFIELLMERYRALRLSAPPAGSESLRR